MFFFKSKKRQHQREKYDTKLEFGCGESKPKPGFVGVDIRKNKYVKYVCNAWDIGSFVKKETISEIYSRHFFEHLTFKQADKTLRAWWKILAPSGKIQIILPDIEYHIKQFLSDDYSTPSEANPKWTNLEHALAGFWGWQREGDAETWDLHKSGYSYKSLKEKLLKHGFTDIKRLDDKAWNLKIVFRKP